jgi:hypothetical protein
MPRIVSRIALAAVAAALAGAVSVAVAYARHPAVALEMDRDPPSAATGFYPAERDRDITFVWTARRAALVLAGADRRVPWTCSIVFRGARPGTIPQPTLEIAADGVTLASLDGTNEFRTAAVVVPPKAEATTLRLGLTSSETFVPSDADRRALGVQVDRVACRPESGWPVPPPRAVTRAALAAGAWAAALGAIGLPTAVAAGMAGALAVAQGVILTTGTAPYGPYADVLVKLSVSVSLVIAASVWALRASRRQPVTVAARIALVVAAAASYLMLIALMHPSKAPVDAVFHAHRLEWVMSGRYYFTQLSTSATPFPYAIGLYVFALPWAALTRDHVTLLRVIVCALDALAGLMLYPLVARAWNDRLAAVLAVVFFFLAPVSFIVIGNANMTNAFGQSISILTLIAAAWTFGRRHALAWGAVIALATLGLVSHVSTLVLLTTTLLAFAVLTWWSGEGRVGGGSLSVLLATIAALVLAVALYWGHFGDLYAEQIARWRGPSVSAAGPPAAVVQADARETGAERTPVLGKDRIPFSGRVVGAADQTVANVGWPMLVMGAAGAWRMFTDRRRDRLTATILAWAVVWAGFVAFSVMSAVDTRYQQDAWEFIGRIEHATYPALAACAGSGTAWAWRAGRATRAGAFAAVLAALFIAARQWLLWLA